MPSSEVLASISETIRSLIDWRFWCLDCLREIDRDPTLAKVAYDLLRTRVLEIAGSLSALGHSRMAAELMERRGNIDVTGMFHCLDGIIPRLIRQYPGIKVDVIAEGPAVEISSLAQMRARLIQMAVVDEQGEILLAEADIPKIMEMPHQDLDRLYTETAKLSEIPLGSQDEFIRRLLSTGEVPTLDAAGMARLQTCLESMTESAMSQGTEDDPTLLEDQRKLREILRYNQHLRGAIAVHAPASQASENQEPFLFSVERWSDLAIGIDEHWRYWAITPPPKRGGPFKKADAVQLPLRGDRWRAIRRSWPLS